MHSSLTVLLAIFSITVGSLRSHAADSVWMTAPDPAAQQPEPAKDNAPQDNAAPQAPPPQFAAPRVAPKSVILALNRWHTSALCNGCNGTGRTIKKEQTGSEITSPPGSVPVIRQPIFRESEIDCAPCDGGKLTKDKRLIASANNFAKALSQVDTTDPAWPAAHDDVRTKLRALVELGKSAWRSRLNNTIGALLTGVIAKNGIPIVFAGYLDDEWEDNDADHRELRVQVDHTTVIFERPRLVDVSGIKPRDESPQGNVLCGGWLIRRDDGNGQFTSVVENGFVMSIR